MSELPEVKPLSPRTAKMLAKRKKVYDLSRPDRIPPGTEKTLFARIRERMSNENLADLLQFSDNEHLTAFIEEILSPRDRVQASRNWFTIAKAHGISAVELVDLIRKAHIDTGIILAAQRVPQIMIDMAEDATNHTEPCWRCDATGKIGEDKCADCHGTGSIEIKGSADSRKLVLEATGVINRRGPLINVPISFGGAPVDSFETLVSRAGDIIEAKATPALPPAEEEP